MAWAQGEPKPASGPPPRAIRASPPPPRAIPARPPGASPCPAKRAPHPRIRPGPGAPHPGAPRRPGPNLTAPPPRGGPRKDPKGNSRLSAQQPKAGQVSWRAGPGPDNDARGSPRPPPSPRPPTRSRPYWNSSQHSLTRLTRATRGPSFPPAPTTARASTCRACPPAWQDPIGGRRGAAGVTPASPHYPVISHPLPSFRWGRLTLCPGKAQSLITADPINGDAPLTHQASAALHAPPTSAYTSYINFPSSRPSSSQSPHFSKRQPQILEVEAPASPGGQPHSLLGRASSQWPEGGWGGRTLGLLVYSGRGGRSDLPQSQLCPGHPCGWQRADDEGCSPALLRYKDSLSLNLGGISVGIIECVGSLPGQCFPLGVGGGLKKVFTYLLAANLVLRTPHHQEFLIEI